MDLAFSGSRAQAAHDTECPEIGPICDVRAEPPQRHDTTLWISELRLLAEYGLTEHLALQLGLPLRIIDTRTRFTDLSGDPIQLDYENIHHSDDTLAGLGDVQLLAHTGLVRGGFAFGARAGISLPTGVVHEDPFRLGAEGRPHQHIQFGTGTFDPIVGLDVGRSFGPWTVSAFGHMQAPLYEGREGYRAGARVSGGIAAARTLRSVSLRLAATLAHERAERWDGAIPEEDGNRGRTDLFVGPGITIPFGIDYSASIDVGVRAYGHAVGAQLDMPVVVSLSVGRLFHLESGRHIEPLPAGPIQGDIADVVLQGEAAPLTRVPGKWTVFDFWASWCEACVDLDAELRQLARDNSEVALRRVNIVTLDSPISQRELRGVTSLPHIRLIDPDGAVAWEASGTPAELTQGIMKRIAAREHSASTGGVQTIQMLVTKDGFEPSLIDVEKGRPVRLVIIRKTDETCAREILIDEFKIKKDLPLNTPVEVTFTPKRSGKFAYACSMNMITGMIHVR